MAEYINKTDTLNDGRVKLNEAISDSNVAKDKSEQADAKSTEALAKSESTQTQLDTIVIEGDSSVEAAQARVAKDGEEYATLKARLDGENEEVTHQLAEKATIADMNKRATKQELTNGLDDTMNYLKKQLEQIGEMTPKGAFASLSDLKSEYPRGTEGIYLTQDDGHWHFWDGIEWVDGGEYQAQPWDAFMSEENESWVA